MDAVNDARPATLRERLINWHVVFSPVLWRVIQYSPVLSWVAIIGSLIASCFLFRAMDARWLWILQGLSPRVSVAALSISLTMADRSCALGWIALPLGIAGSRIGVPFMTFIYALLALSNLGAVAFYVAVGAKLLVGYVGFVLIYKVRRSMQGYEPVRRVDSFA